MRKLRKVLIMVLVVTLIISGTLIAHAYTYICSYSSGLKISGGTATCTGDVLAERSKDACSITLTLKKEISSGVWSSVATWTGSDTGYASLLRTKSVSSGYRYKVTMKGVVNGESVSIDSSIKAY